MEWLITNLIGIFDLPFFTVNRVFTESIELIFFTVASRMLCFGFVLKTMVITSGCFSYCSSEFYSESRDFLPLTPSYQQGGFRGTRIWEGTEVDTRLQPTKGSFHNIWCHAQHISWWKKEEGEKMIFRVMAFVFSSDHYM